MAEEYTDQKTGNRLVPLQSKHRVLSKMRLYPPSFPVVGFNYVSYFINGIDKEFIAVYTATWIEQKNLTWALVGRDNPDYNPNIPEDPVTNPAKLPMSMPQGVIIHSWNNFVTRYVGPSGKFLVFLEQNYRYVDGETTFIRSPGVVLEFNQYNTWNLLGLLDSAFMDSVTGNVGYPSIRYCPLSVNSRLILMSRFSGYGDETAFDGQISSCDPNSFSTVLPTNDSKHYDPVYTATYAGNNRVLLEYNLGLGIARCAEPIVTEGGTVYHIKCYVYVGEAPQFENNIMLPIDPTKTVIVDTITFRTLAGSDLDYTTMYIQGNYEPENSTNDFLDGWKWGGDGPAVLPLSAFIRANYEGLYGCVTKMMEGYATLGRLCETTVFNSWLIHTPGGVLTVEYSDYSLISFKYYAEIDAVIGGGPFIPLSIDRNRVHYIAESDAFHRVDNVESNLLSIIPYSVPRTGYMPQFEDDPTTGYYYYRLYGYTSGGKILGEKLCAKGVGTANPTLTTHSEGTFESSNAGVSWTPANENNYSGLVFPPTADSEGESVILNTGVDPSTSTRKYMEVNGYTPSFLGCLVPGSFIKLESSLNGVGLPASEGDATLTEYALSSSTHFVMPASEPPLKEIETITLVWPQGTDPIPSWTWNGQYEIIDYVTVKLQDENAIPTDSLGNLPRINVEYIYKFQFKIKVYRSWTATQEEIDANSFCLVEDQEFFGVVPISFRSMALKVLPTAIDPEYATEVVVPPDETSLTLLNAPGSLGSYYRNFNYIFAVPVYGGDGPYTWGLTQDSGDLPPGATLSASTGMISIFTEGPDGDPAETYSFTVRVTDSSTPTVQAVQAVYSLTVVPR